MKILWHSVAPWAPTGYGQQTALFAPRVKALGHDVLLSVYYGLQGREMEWEGIRCLPSYGAPYGTDVLIPHAMRHFGGEAKSLAEVSYAGMVLTLGDVWTFDVPVELLQQFAVASWVPIDHLTVPDIVREWFGVMGAIPIAMSRFGEKALAEAGHTALYVPHGVDTTVYRPGDQAEARVRTGVPADAFVVGMVANNVGRDGNRKAFAEQIAAFRGLHEQHSDAFLILHTDVHAPGGTRLKGLLERELPRGSYSYSDTYAYRKGLAPVAVADIYRSMDVLTNTSYGEGFGVPIVEAQACGRPVVVTDSTAMSELVGPGWAVGYERTWHDSQGAWASIPRIGDIYDAYMEAYGEARDPLMRDEAWAFAQQYDADTVAVKHWEPALNQLTEALERRRETVQRRAARPRRQTVERIRESDGYFWVDRGQAADDWVADADHEEWLDPIMDRLLPEGGVLLDIGAHVGRWAIRLAAKASRVVAVEANPTTAATLRRHLAMNDVHNVDVLEFAAWDEETRLIVTDPNGKVDGGGTRTLPTADVAEADRPSTYAGYVTCTVRGGRLDQELTTFDLVPAGKTRPRLDLIKIDVEGADLHVLRGLSGLLERYRPTMVIECHDIYGYYERADLEQTLTDLGYVFEVAASVPSNWQPGVGVINEIRDGDYLVATPAP